MQLDNKRHIVQNAFDALREDRPFLKEIRLRDVRQRLGADVSLPTAIKWTRRLCKEHGLTYSGRNDLTPEMLLGIVHSHYMTGHSPSKNSREPRLICGYSLSQATRVQEMVQNFAPR